MDDADTWRRVDLTLAIVAAVVVAYGVLVLNWSVFVVVALFWLENVVIGVLNVAKMLISGARLGSFGLIAALALATFFTVHYGMFTVGHGVFVASLFGKAELGGSLNGLFAPLGRMLGYLLSDRDGWFAAASIASLQAAAFFRWWSATREDPAALPTLMFAPYGRIVILHVTVIAGGLLVGVLGQPVLGALLLIGLKLAFDIASISKASSGKQASPLLPVPRFIAAREDDATRP
ncbi:MAG TPA: DUF6498-containing protein [Burkholderiaceae bacterium]|nr:DUF6498-containing protein [Burkholderiaceae bacterium]